MSDGRDAELHAVIDKQAISDVIHRLARAIDRCDKALIASCFHEDATDDHGSFKGTAAEFCDWVIPVLQSMEATQHNIHNVLIELSGSNALSESYFVAHHRIATPDGPNDMIAAGRYLDRFEKRDGKWRIAHRHAIYDWSRNDPSTCQWDKPPAADILERGKRGETDPSYAHFLGRS